MALGGYGDAFGAYLGGAAQGLAQQQNALNSMYNQQAQNQSFYGGMQGGIGVAAGSPDLSQLMGAYYSSQRYIQQGVACSPPEEPKQAVKKKLRNEPDEDFKATDYDEGDSGYFLPAWKRRLQKRYPEGAIIGGFVRRLALELDMWHQNAAGLPA